jgi:hypothetical protein
VIQIRSITTGARQLQIAVSSPPRLPLMVVSHERSGTHFLMNSLARSYGYVSNPWVNLDLYPFAINYYLPTEIERLLVSLAKLNLASITKSHHPASFLDGVLDSVAQHYAIFYIHRDPVDVMLSFFRFMHHWKWHEGPKLDDPVAFAQAQPEGQMMRYQLKQHQSLLHRWQSHVEGWLAAAATRPRITMVRYEDLRDDYATTLQRFAGVLGTSPGDLTPPPREKDTIHVPENPAHAAITKSPSTVKQLRKLAAETVGSTMAKLGYSVG